MGDKDKGFKFTIKVVDMEDKMQQFAIQTATTAFSDFKTEREISNYIKQSFDKEYGPIWNCIVGRNFGSHVTHQTRKYMFFAMGEISILLWKSG
mmetsp:Transcript_34326/g.38908  ORF Transcript_34326/g.38908 Transcript_34326/m.38908 type:complete len:94 (+) Transcript_34326:86-367(+)|eukprot:CAMPEP_0114984888 /NCGR_PEP_ID=MMETSP0216-20121206/7539_1 /TAXON_ID=223996 /ORGANISM="Protocruzia adherens, Strain Boccale" /LENGTH=93 /DNA_ID=CAMNT_0002347099 /DNA_START=61 /DNA_END=342 /DNA_ORIENTATION=+